MLIPGLSGAGLKGFLGKIKKNKSGKISLEKLWVDQEDSAGRPGAGSGTARSGSYGGELEILYVTQRRGPARYVTQRRGPALYVTQLRARQLEARHAEARWMQDLSSPQQSDEGRSRASCWTFSIS